MAFDLNQHDFSKSAEQGYTFNLKLPNGVDSDAKLTVLGDLSSTVKNYARKKYQELQQQAKIAKRKGKDEDMSLEEAEEFAVEAALIRLIGWEGIVEDKKVVEFSKDKARELLTRHGWIREQIMEESADVSNFTPKTLKT